MTSWRKATLGELADENGGFIQTGPFGSQLHMSDYSDHGTPVVMPTNIRNLRIDPTGIARVDAGHVERLARHQLRAGDIVYSRRGDVEKCALVTETEAGWLCGTGCLLVRSSGPNLDSRFLSYSLSQPATRAWISQHAVGATMPNLNTGILREVPVEVPEHTTQIGIAATLGSLDDKVASNQAIAALIPQTIRAHIRSALPGTSSHVPVSTLARFVNGGAYTKGATGSGRMVLRIAELNAGPGASTVYNDIEVPEDKTARAGDILMSWSGSLDVFRWFRNEAIVNQHIFKVIPTGYPAWLVFDRLKAAMPEFRAVAADKATTMGHIQRGHLSTTTVPIPNPVAVKALESKLAPLWERLLLAERENLKLAALRDTLIPELLSGRIRIPLQEKVA